MAKVIEIKVPISPEVPAGAVNAAMGQLKRLLSVTKGKMASPIDAAKINADAGSVSKSITRIQAGFKDFSAKGVEAARRVADALKGVGKSGEDAGAKVSSGFKGLAVGGALAAVGVGVGALSKKMIDGNAELEGYMTQFEVMTGSLDNAQKLFGDIKKMGAATPFETADLAAATQTMLGFGESQEDIIPNLQMLGDISGGNAEKMKSLTLTFSQIQSAGKLMGGDLLQLIGQGFNPLKIISEKTGKSMGELKKEVEEGKISFEMVEDAMKTATAAGGTYHGMMAKMSGTMTGMKSTLSDVATETLNTMGKPLFEETKKAMGGLLTLLQSPEIQASVAKLGQSVAPLVGALAGALQQLLPVILQVFGIFGEVLGPVAKGLGDIVGPLAGVLASTMKSLAPVIKIVVEFLARIMGVLGDVMKQLQGPLSQVLGLVANLLGVILAPVLKIVGDLFAAVAPILVPLVTLLATLLQALMPLIEIALWPIVKVLELFAGLITGVVNVAVKLLTGFVTMLSGALGDAVETVKAAAQAVSDFFSDLFSGQDAAAERAEASGDRIRAAQAKKNADALAAQVEAQRQADAQREKDAAAAADAKAKAEAKAAADAKARANAAKPKTTKAKADDTELAKAQKLIEAETKRLNLAERLAQNARETKRIQEGRAKDSTDELQTELGRLKVLQDRLALMKSKFLNEKGEVKITINAEKGESREAVAQTVAEANAEVTEQQNKLKELRLELVPEIDNEAIRNLQREQLTLQIEAGVKVDSDLTEFMKGDVEILRTRLQEVTDKRMKDLQRARELELLTLEEFNAQETALRANQGADQLEILNSIASTELEIRQRQYDAERKLLEDRNKAEDAAAKRSEAIQGRVYDTVLRFTEKLGTISISDTRSSELKLTEARHAAGLIDEQKYEEEKAFIAKKAAARQVSFEALAQGQRIEQERMAALASLGIQRDRLQRERELAEKHGDTKRSEEITGQLDEINQGIDDKSSVMQNTVAELQGNITDMLSSLFSGDPEAIKDPFRQVFGILMGALQRLASAKITEVILGSISGLTGFGGFIAALASKPLVEGLINALLSPVFRALTSFATGGRVDSPGLFMAGDGGRFGGTDREWILRDDQLRALLIEAATAGQRGMASQIGEMRDEIKALNQKDWRIQGEDIVLSEGRVKQAAARRQINKGS